MLQKPSDMIYNFVANAPDSIAKSSSISFDEFR